VVPSAEEIAAAKAGAEKKLADLTAAGNADAKALKAAEDAVKALGDEKKAKDATLTANLTGALKAAGYPAKADPAKVDKVTIIIILTYLVILVTMVYGPIAAMLVELFPTRIRYTSMSLPYHIGNGWFGGLLPTTAFAIVAQTGNMYNGLWYPIIIATMTFIIGTLFIKETKDVDIYAND
jgi:Sugar (and other) transporter